MISKVCFVCFFFCCVLNWESSYVLGVSKQEKEQEILLKLLDESRYDKRVRPSGKDDKGPTIVTVNLYVRSIDVVDDIKMEYGVQLTFRQEWNDKRLAYDNNTDEFKYLSLIDISQVWIPDLFFANEKTAHLHELMRPNHYLRIWPNGNVLYSARITMTLKCPMIMKQFPFDTQSCSMRMASYGYTNEDIIFKWKAEKPVQFPAELPLPKFALEDSSTDHCDSTTNTGTYSCIRAEFLLRREFKHYLLTIYIPSTMIVIVAWLGSWLDRKSVTARILICLSTLFVLATEVSRFNTSLPIVGYTKSIDIWTGMSLTFVFACLIEFVVVNYLSRLEDEQKANSSTEGAQESPNNEEVPLTDKHLDVEVQQSKKNIRQTAENLMSRLRCKSQKVDDVFRIVFPITFTLFVIFYAAAC